MKNKYIILVFIFIQLFAFSEEKYSPVFINTILYGEKENELGWNSKDFIPGMGYQRPLDFAVSETGKIYIYDWAKNRIAIYDGNANYLGEIKPKNYYIGPIYHLIVDENYGIYLGKTSGLLKLDFNSNKIYYKLDSVFSSDTLAYDNYFPHKGNLLFYSKKNEIDGFDEIGNKLEPGRINNILTEMDTSMDNESRSTNDVIDIRKDIKEYSKNHKIIINGYKLYSKATSDFIDYVKYLRSKTKTQKSDKSSSDIKDLHLVKSLGYDTDSNAYWEGSNNLIYIFSKYGDIIKIIEYDPAKCGINPKASPDGDIFFWKFELGKSVSFNRILRDW